MSDRIKEVAIAGLVLLETTALLTHTDGVFFSIIIGAVCGIAGYKFGKHVCEAER